MATASVNAACRKAIPSLGRRLCHHDSASPRNIDASLRDEQPVVGVAATGLLVAGCWWLDGGLRSTDLQA
jgi:hypothetical protein